MRRGAHLVFVPDRLSLPTSVLDRILQEADVPFAALIAAIEELPTEPELHIIEPDR